MVVAAAGRGRRLPVFYSGSAGGAVQRSVDADPAGHAEGALG